MNKHFSGRGRTGKPVRHTVGLADLSQLIDPELDALERFTDARLAAKGVQGLKEGQ